MIENYVIYLGNLTSAIRSLQDFSNTVIIAGKTKSLDFISFLDKSTDVIFCDFDNLDEIVSLTAEVVKKKGVPREIVTYSEMGTLAKKAICDLININQHGLENLEHFHHKGKMREVLETSKIPQVFFVWGEKEKVYKAILETKHIPFPLIIKPIDGAGGININKINSIESLELWYSQVTDPSTTWIAESFISGKEFSIETITIDRHHYMVGITEKLTSGEPHFIETGHLFPAKVSNELYIEIKNYVFKALDSLGAIDSVCHTEVIVQDNSKIFIVESHLRPGGDSIPKLVEAVSGIDLYRMSFDKPYQVDNLNRLECHNTTFGACNLYLLRSQGFLTEVSLKQLPDNIEFLSGGIFLDYTSFANRTTNSATRMANMLFRGNYEPIVDFFRSFHSHHFVDTKFLNS